MINDFDIHKFHVHRIIKPNKGSTKPFAAASDIQVAMGGNFHQDEDPGHILVAAELFPHE